MPEKRKALPTPLGRVRPSGRDWASVTWADFEEGLTAYRDHECSGQDGGAGERAYFELVDELDSVPIAERASHAASIVLFLNRWRCRLPTAASRAAVAAWLGRESGALEALTGLSILDSEGARQVDEFDRLHDSLIALRKGDPPVATMSPAAASKLLHQMVPALFVMWDAKIRVGFAGYGAFMLAMHGFALRLRDELAPPNARADIEGYLQSLLGEPRRKPLAKYIDEYNWWVAWRLGTRADAS